MTDSISKGKSAAGANSDSKFEYAPLDLNALRGQLVRLEDTIIFGFVERAQFKQNPKAYKPDAIHIKGAGGATQFLGSYFSYFLTENEKVHAAMRRYTSPDEHPFTPYSFLPRPVLPELKWPKTLRQPNEKWSFNQKILDFYFKDVLPSLCTQGDDQHYGSSVTCDVALIQALSKRINYGKFVAEIKYRKNKELLRRLRAAKDMKGLRSLITKPDVEEKILQRVRLKAVAYGNPDALNMIDDACTSDNSASTTDNNGKIDKTKAKINPEVIGKLYETIMELTKQVQIKYLLERPLDD